MAKQSRFPSVLRIILFSIAGVFILLLFCNMIISSTIERKLRAALKSVPGTKIEFSSASANIFTRSISLDSAHVYYYGEHQDKYQHEFQLSKLKLGGIHLFSLWKENKLIINSISMENGNLILAKSLLLDTAATDSMVALPFTEFNAGKVEIKNMDMRIRTDSTDELSWNGDLTMLKIKSGKDGTNLSMEHLRPEELKCELQRLNVYLPESHKTISVKKLTLNSNGSSGLLDSITCTSDYSMKEFSRKMGFQADWLNLVINSVDMEGLDVLSMLDNKLHVSKITVHNSNTHVYRDRSIPRKLINKKLPVDMLKDIQQDIRIDTIVIEPATFDYEEFPETGFASGVISMKNTTATICNICNHPLEGDPDHITMKTRTSLNGSGVYTQTLHFPFEGKNYTTEGNIRNLDLTKLNTSSENLGLIHIESGILNDLNFQFAFNDVHATGTVTGDYNNLKIDKMKFDKNKNLTKATLPTFLEKTFIIPENRDKSVPADKRTGKVDVKYDPTRLTSFYIMQALLSGIRSSFPLGFLI
jgi:hypothetical protein